MKVIILRGVSGSGKSTWINNHYPEAVIASADAFFLQDDGTYKFNDEDRHEAHKVCFQTFINAAIQKKPLIIIDNSNIELWEFTPYVMPAESFGYEVEILTLKIDPEIAIARKQNIPPDRVRRTAELLLEAEKIFPDFIKKIHRYIEQDSL